MIAGIGIDIVEHRRIVQIHDRYREKFARRILDEAEMQDYLQASSQEKLLAKRFAAKEAAAKALGTGFSAGITLHMITIHHDEHGKPLLALSDRAAACANKLGVVNQLLSISDEQNYAIAMVVLETAD
jgi:holo-[acyl-carrier protein] synthase